MRMLPSSLFAAALLAGGNAPAQITIQIETNAQVEVTGGNTSNMTSRSFNFPGGSAKMFMLGGGDPTDDIMAQMDEMIRQMHEQMGLTDPFLVVPGAAPAGVVMPENGGFLGVLPAEISEELREHLGLEDGAMVGEVTPGSPAENAGLQPRDIVLSVDGKPVAGPAGLVDLVSAGKPGDEVALKVLRKGKEMTIKVALAERPARAARGIGPGRGRGMRAPVMPNIQSFSPGPGGGSFSTSFSSSVRSMNMSNERGSFSFSEKDGEKTFTAKDPSGNVLFDGPVNTDEEKKKVPEEVRDMLDQLESGQGGSFRINIQPGGGPALPPPPPPAPGAPPKKRGVSI